MYVLKHPDKELYYFGECEILIDGEFRNVVTFTDDLSDCFIFDDQFKAYSYASALIRFTITKKCPEGVKFEVKNLKAV